MNFETRNDSIKKSGQFCGGLLIMQKCDAIINLFQECLNILRNNKLLITDVYNKKQYNNDFFSHHY